MPITFNTIPIDLLRPGNYVEFSNRNAIAGLLAQPQKILAIGQRLTTGTVTAGVPTQIVSSAQAESAFGRGSMLAQMCATVLAANRFAELWAVALDDAVAGVAAAGDITFTGTATAAGTINVYIGGQRVRVAVAVGDTAAEIATALTAAITADTSLPVTAAVDGVDTDQVDVTARHKGEAGNGIDLQLNYTFGEALPAGITAAITAMSAGAGNPDVTTAISAIGATQYNTVLLPYTDATSLAAIEDELGDRWEGTAANDGHAYAAFKGTYATTSTLGDSRNSPHVCIMGTGKSPTLPWVFAANFGAVVATQNAPSNLGRPLQTLALEECLPPKNGEEFTPEEREQLLRDGIATYYVDDGGLVRIERAVTTYKTNESGAPDPSYRDVERLRILSYLRFDVRSFVSQRHPRSLLKADDGAPIPAGLDIVTPSIMREEILGRFQAQWLPNGLVEDFAQFKQDLVVEIDGIEKDRLNAVIPPNCINGLRQFYGRIDFRI